MIGITGYNKAVAIEGALIVAEVSELGGIERYSPQKNAWETIAIEDSEDDYFRIEALCTFSKKYLSKNLENMNNNK